MAALSNKKFKVFSVWILRSNAGPSSRASLNQHLRTVGTGSRDSAVLTRVTSRSTSSLVTPIASRSATLPRISRKPSPESPHPSAPL